MVLSKRDCLFVVVVSCILLVIDNEEAEVWNVKAMNLKTGSGSIEVYRWNSSTQSEPVTSSDHVHFLDVRHISCFFSASASYSSFFTG